MTPAFKWPVGVTRRMPASAGDVWDVISRPGNLHLCHPFCAQNPVTDWPGPKSRDEVHYLNGVIYERRFKRWIEGAGYDLDIGLRDGPSSFVSWRITPRGDSSSELAIVVQPHVLQGVPTVIRWIPHLARVRPLLRDYLSSVVRGFEWYLRSGEPVPRNQFGTHPWFS